MWALGEGVVDLVVAESCCCAAEDISAADGWIVELRVVLLDELDADDDDDELDERVEVVDVVE